MLTLSYFREVVALNIGPWSASIESKASKICGHQNRMSDSTVVSWTPASEVWMRILRQRMPGFPP